MIWFLATLILLLFAFVVTHIRIGVLEEKIMRLEGGDYD